MGQHFPDEPTPDLDDWLRTYDADDNEFWRTPLGDLQNLFDEAVERMRTAEAARLAQEQTR